MLQQDPLAYRPLLLRLSQSGTSVLPMGALRLLASYARCAACCAPAVHGPHGDSGLHRNGSLQLLARLCLKPPCFAAAQIQAAPPT